MSQSKIRRYEGKALHVVYDQALCVHAKECGRSRGALFEGGREPWCQPDAATPADAAEILSRCPSGALSASDVRGRPLLEAPAPNQITVAHDGPLFVRGQLELEGAPESSPGQQRRLALCRCGHSSRKPYCDNSHRKAAFHDAGAVGVRANEVRDFSGPLQISPQPNGPLVFTGAFALLTGAGRVAWTGKRAVLCRCGRSKDKPFCDGSHESGD